MMQALDLNRVPALGPFGTVAIARFGCCMQPRRTWSVRGREAGTRALSDRNSKDQRDREHGWIARKLLELDEYNMQHGTCLRIARQLLELDEYPKHDHEEFLRTNEACTSSGGERR